jgi:hypothetical protein
MRSQRTAPSTVEPIVAGVERTSETPSPGTPPPEGLTLDSPIEDLALSSRARNALRKAGCSTIRSLVQKDFSRAAQRLGPITRAEILDALARHGFQRPATLPDETTSRIADLDREVRRLKEQIDRTWRHWQTRVSRLEHRLKKIHRHEPGPSS